MRRFGTACTPTAIGSPALCTDANCYGTGQTNTPDAQRSGDGADITQAKSDLQLQRHTPGTRLLLTILPYRVDRSTDANEDGLLQARPHGPAVGDIPGDDGCAGESIATRFHVPDAEQRETAARCAASGIWL
jgi:hypothetical protein